LLGLYGVPVNRVTVAYPGGGKPPPAIDQAVAAARVKALGIDRPFVLHVGRVEPRKNQISALAATERLPDLLFVSAGSPRDGGLTGRLRQSPRARLLGAVPPADLEALYSQAQALCFPSLYEGFGFPVVEAMARGLPVVTSAVSSLPEAGGEAALYVQDPFDVEGLSAALEQAISQRSTLAALGRSQAAGFTWDKCTQTVASVIRELVDNG
jgi:glycosyltransferase involved in cell wall biosynthesis